MTVEWLGLGGPFARTKAGSLAEILPYSKNYLLASNTTKLRHTEQSEKSDDGRDLVCVCPSVRGHLVASPSSDEPGLYGPL